MRVLFCGSRTWKDAAKIAEQFDIVQPTIVIEGEAAGADTLARLEAERRGIRVLPFDADWDIYGKAAGPIRNKRMLTEGKPDLVIAFHPFLRNSKGTKDMVLQAEKAGIPVKVIT
jgi:hypothetical protein